MKRSEMIKIIRDSLYKHITIDWNDISDDDDSIGALLKDLEDAGMIPPEVYVSCGPFERYEHEWEKE